MSVGTTAVIGSIATDHLMHFPGRFADHLVADRLDRLSLSFLVEGLVVHRGGVGANIAFGMGVLRQRPVLVGAVGADFAEHRTVLEAHGVECGEVSVVAGAHTPRFTCMTDDDQCQLASFYPGAMTATRSIDLAPIVARHGIELVLVGASDPVAMVEHTGAARRLGVAFAADPSQQLPRLTGEECHELVDGARYLFCNEYEAELLVRKSGWQPDEITRRVGLWVITRGARGLDLRGRDGLAEHVDAIPARVVVDPTGAGDGFRAGFLAGVGAGLGPVRAAQLGTLIATLVLETDGGQEWTIDAEADLARLAAVHGAAAAADIGPLLRAVSARPSVVPARP